MIRWTDEAPLGREPLCSRCNRRVFGPASWEASTLLVQQGDVHTVLLIRANVRHDGCGRTTRRLDPAVCFPVATVPRESTREA